MADDQNPFTTQGFRQVVGDLSWGLAVPHYSGIPPLAHNIRGHSREGPSSPSSLVFPNCFPCAGTGLAAHPRANAYGWDAFWRFLPWGPSGRKISITPIYYPSVRGRATKSRAYAARACSTRPFTSEPMRTESAVSLKINLSPARTIIARVRAVRPLGHVTLADARHLPDGQSSNHRLVRKTRRGFSIIDRNCPRNLPSRWTLGRKELAPFKVVESISRESWSIEIPFRSEGKHIHGVKFSRQSLEISRFRG